MIRPPSPPVPQYRVTLFYGPESDDQDADILYCVFNVKKRNWKGGVQVVVKLEREQFKRLKQKLSFGDWLSIQLSTIPKNEREEFVRRGEDILAQCICQAKLMLAIRDGLKQENGELAPTYLFTELEEIVEKEEHSLKTQVEEELDVSSFE